MRRFAVLVAIAQLVVSCSPEGEPTGLAQRCATDLYPTYNPATLDQCVDVCLKCGHGTMTTCSTSCTIKGAH
jgi:hypothetical protein